MNSFKAAEERMVNALTLQEKKLAKEFSESATYNKENSAAYLRSPVINLGSWQAMMKQFNKTRPIRRLYLYCDTLEIPDSFLFSAGDLSSEMQLTIFVREIKCLGSPQTALKMDFIENAKLEIFTYALPPDFCVHLRTREKTWITEKLVIGENNWGIRLNNMGDPEPLIEQSDLAELNMSTTNYLDRLKDDGTLSDDGEFINDNLARLVHYQFLVATSVMHIDRKFALDVLQWVCNLTASQSSAELNVEACSLRHDLVLSTTHGVFNVPSVNIYASKQVLKARLIAAKAYEDAFQNFVAQDRTNKNFGGQAADLFAKCQDALSEYAFLEDTARRAYDAAHTAHLTPEKRFQEEQKGLEQIQRRFSKGLDAWVEEKKEEAAKEALFACFEVVASVVAVVATAGAAAPSAAAAGAEAAKGVSKFAQTMKRIAEIAEKINDVYEKLEPVITKIMELVEKIKGLVASLQAAQDLKEKTVLQTPDMSTDIFNATATWDIFREQVDSMEKQLADVDCDGKSEYFLHLRMLVIDGKTYLQTNENLIQRGNDLAVVLIKKKMGEREKDRVQASVNSIDRQAAVYDVLVRAMFDRLLTIRSLVFLDFNTYSDAYMFHCLSSYPPVVISPVKPIVDYLEDAAKIQGMVADFGSRVMVQERRFTLRAPGGVNGVSELRKRLQTTGRCTVSFDPSDEAFKGFCRIRVWRARCYLEGVKAAAGASPSTLRLNLRTPGRFYDIDLPGHADSTQTISATARKAFVGDPRFLLFEYDIKDSSIICDGEYRNQRDCTLQSPITEWEVEVAKGGLQVKDLDLAGLSGLRFELWCDVTLASGVILSVG